MTDPLPTTTLTGYYSFRTAQKFGYAVYRTPNGKTVEVTEVSSDKLLSSADDLKCQGSVTEFVCRQGPLGQMLVYQDARPTH
jgi:hypothetical protein